MAIATTITVASVVYNVYGLTSDPVSDADDYFALRLGATSWTGAATLAKQQAVVTSARFLDRGVLYTGAKTVSSQALQWPRDKATCRGVAVTDNTIPDDIALGQFELALALLEDESVQDATSGGAKTLKSVRTDSVNLEFFGAGAVTGAAIFRRFPTVVHELVGCFAAGGPSEAKPFSSGVDSTKTDESTHFDDATNSHNLNRGFP